MSQSTTMAFTSIQNSFATQAFNIFKEILDDANPCDANPSVLIKHHHTKDPSFDPVRDFVFLFCSNKDSHQDLSLNLLKKDDFLWALYNYDNESKKEKIS